ncbi:MAG: outer membrane beta-barrel protein [Deltaproteobacteria bacterium]|nr:outer membrane beta-barrel protein [Deltaproteobacteria bacterium]
MEPEEPPTPPSAVPVIVTDPCGGGVSVMAHRFAVGINLGAMSVTADDDVAQNETQFRTAELSIRYRATPHFELELLLSGGRQVLEDGEDGELAMGGGTLAARYRFRPHRAWNWWLMGGLGATVIERHDSSEEARDAANRGHVAFGIGLERRFRRLALHAELRGMAMGPRSDEMETDGRGSLGDPRTAANLSGGQFNFGASFYF